MDRLFVGNKRRPLLHLFATSDDNDEKIISEPKNPAVKPPNEFEWDLLPRCAMESISYREVPS